LKFIDNLTATAPV